MDCIKNSIYNNIRKVLRGFTYTAVHITNVYILYV
jgi:hypothetical protein